jgi:outer membrane protein with beta-barrel domain
MLTLMLALCVFTSDVDPRDPAILAADPANLYETLALVDQPRFAVGVHLGWFQMNDAEDGELFYGIHGRAYFAKMFAIEASIDVAEQDFLDDDATLSLVPVQVTGMIFLPLDSAIRPYGLVGIGWYFTDIDYSGDESLSDDESDNTFGFHLGVGAEMLVGKLIMLHADLRYVFFDEPDFDNDSIDGENFDYWQLSIGAAIAF